MRANRSCMEHFTLHPYVCVYEAVYAIYLDKRVCVFVFPPPPPPHPDCTSVRGNVCPCMDIAAWARVCMSTILDRACEGCLSMCVPLSVRSSRRQQGAPFQFTHQPRRKGVKARGIAVGDFTFEGRDYQSGDPCVEVMREGDCRGTVWGSRDCWGKRGSVERREGSTTQRHPGIRGLSVFWGA